VGKNRYEKARTRWSFKSGTVKITGFLDVECDNELSVVYISGVV
jgi:hypothetical protein